MIHNLRKITKFLKMHTNFYFGEIFKMERNRNKATSSVVANPAIEAKPSPPKVQSWISSADIFWMVSFIFVFRQFDVLDALRYDTRIDW
jgi:hypothetical protein